MRFITLILLFTLSFLLGFAKTEDKPTDSIFYGVFWEGYDVVFFPQLEDQKSSAGVYGEFHYNFYQPLEKECNGKKVNYALYNNGVCRALSSTVSEDTTYKRTSKDGENLTFAVTLKNGESLVAKENSTTVLNFICDEEAKDVKELDTLKYNHLTTTYSSTTKASWACPDRIVHNILDVSDNLGIAVGIILLAIGLLIVALGIKFFKAIVITICFVAFASMTTAVYLVSAPSSSSLVFCLTVLVGGLIGAAIGFCIAKSRKVIVGFVGLALGLSIGSGITVILTGLFSPLVFLGLVIIVVLMVIGFKIAYTLTDYVIILCLNLIAFSFNFAGLFSLISMPIGAAVVLALEGNISEVSRRSTIGLIVGFILSALLFVTGCFVHWRHVNSLEKDEEGNSRLIIVHTQ